MKSFPKGQVGIQMFFKHCIVHVSKSISGKVTKSDDLLRGY